MQGGQSGQEAEQEWAAEGGSGAGRERWGRDWGQRGRLGEGTLVWGKTRRQEAGGEERRGSWGCGLHHPTDSTWEPSNTKRGAPQSGEASEGRPGRVGSSARLPVAGSTNRIAVTRPGCSGHEGRQAGMLRLRCVPWSAVHLHAALQPAGLPRRVPPAQDGTRSNEGNEQGHAARVGRRGWDGVLCPGPGSGGMPHVG